MRVKGNRINCSPKMMAELLSSLDGPNSEYKFNSLVSAPYEGVPYQVYVFLSGAKLSRCGPSEWFIHSYTNGSAEGMSALYDLQAANHIRRAKQLLDVSQSLRKVPRAKIRKYTHLAWTVYGPVL